MVQFKVDHEHFSSTMCMMNKFREDSSLCDIKLKIGNQTLQAHRCVLAAGSCYFNTLFLGQFTEANMNEIDLSEVTTNITALKKVVTFIYTGEIDIDEENLAVIIKLSSFFLIESLRNFCCTYMTDNLSLDTCLRYYLLSIDHGLFVVEKNAEQLVRSRFHDYLIYEENTLDISANEMKLLVEKNVHQHCSNVSIARFVAMWVNKWLTERHVLIATSIFDDLVLRENSPEVCLTQLTNDISEDSLYQMVKSSLSVKCKSRDMFLKSFKNVLQKHNSENDIPIIQTNSDHRYSSKETAIITVSPSYENTEFHKKSRTKMKPFVTENKHFKFTTDIPILQVCAYIPRTRCWYHLKNVYDDKSSLALLNGWDGMWKFDVFHEEILLMNYDVEELLVSDINTLENCDFEKLEYHAFLQDESNQTGLFQDAYDICVAAGKHNSRYIVSKVARFNNSHEDRFLGTYFSGYKLHEDGKTWEKQFQTDLFNAPDDKCSATCCMKMYARISSASNEMIVVHSADKLTIVFVVDLNQENANPITLLSEEILDNDMIIGQGTKIVEANDAMYIVTDGTAVKSSYHGTANVRYEYKLNSLRLSKIHSKAANIGQLNETYNHSKTTSHDGVFIPFTSEMSASIGDGLWYLEGDMDNASFLTKVSVDDDKNPIVEHHTPPPFPSVTAMFACNISRKILENKKPVTRFFQKE